MQFTGTSSVTLPQVNQFSFCFTGVKVSDTGVINFNFYDTGSGVFSFVFSGGIISSNKPICTYNTIDRNSISGSFQNGLLNYFVNGIFGQENVSFSKLNKISVIANSSKVLGDLTVTGPKINYSVGFLPNYGYGGNLTGTVVTDTAFQIVEPSFQFFNSNLDLLNNPYSATGIKLNSGINNIIFQDIDSSFFEYLNSFYFSMPTTFGNIGGNFSSYRTGIINQSTLSFVPNEENVYAMTSLFGGEWMNDEFIYVDNPSTYNLGFSYGSFTFEGIENNSNLSVVFQPLSPVNGGAYSAQYITGFVLQNTGKYSIPPSVQFSQYYYVTGLQTPNLNFLFCSGCTGAIPVTFSGGNPISGASGLLYLKPVTLSGIYSSGKASFMVVSGYSGISSGYGYQTVPNFVLGTGGGCFSVPDASGYQTAQFRFASGLGAVYAQAAGLTGIVSMSFDGISYSVSGVDVTNIGFGYSPTFLPTISFLRNSSDLTDVLLDFSGNPILDLNGNPIQTLDPQNEASGQFLMKSTGNYQFGNFWDISYNIGKGSVPLSNYTGYFSGSVPLYGGGNVSIQINCSNLDNTSPVSGLLTTSFSSNGKTIVNQEVIYQTRNYDLNTGSLQPFSSPTISFIPLPDLSYILNNDPFGFDYQENYGGGTVDKIISF